MVSAFSLPLKPVCPRKKQTFMFPTGAFCSSPTFWDAGGAVVIMRHHGTLWTYPDGISAALHTFAEVILYCFHYSTLLSSEDLSSWQEEATHNVATLNKGKSHKLLHFGATCVHVFSIVLFSCSMKIVWASPTACMDIWYYGAHFNRLRAIWNAIIPFLD